MTVTIAILTVILTQGLVARREVTKSVKDEIAKKAPYEYVDTQDKNITSSLQQHVEESNRQDEAVMSLIQSMDHKIDILLTNRK